MSESVAPENLMRVLLATLALLTAPLTAFAASGGGCTDEDGDGYTTDCGGNDCDDDDEDVHPGATELCDAIDNDCDGLVDSYDDSLNETCLDNAGTSASNAIQAWASVGTTSTSGTDFLVSAMDVTITAEDGGDVTIDGSSGSDNLALITDGDVVLVTVDGIAVVSLDPNAGGLTVNLEGGNDFLEARLVTDAFAGGLEVNAGGGDDWVQGTDAADVIRGEGGNDTLYGGDGNDTLNGGSNDDEIYGEGGDDTVYGGDGADIVYGGDDDDTLYGHWAGSAGTTTDYVYGDDGEDYILATGYLYGGDDYDSLHGGDNLDRIYGHAADDLGTFLDHCARGPGGDKLFCLDNANEDLAQRYWTGRMYISTLDTYSDGYTPKMASFVSDSYTGEFDAWGVSYFVHMRVLNESGYEVDAAPYLWVEWETLDGWFPTIGADNHKELEVLPDGDAETAYFAVDYAELPDERRIDAAYYGFKLGMVLKCNGMTHTFYEDVERGFEDSQEYWNIVITPDHCTGDDWDPSFYAGFDSDDEAIAAAMD
jgi:hypothetical protein